MGGDSGFDFAYDRAALVAVESKQRSEYVSVMKRLLSKSGIVLAVTLEFEEAGLDPKVTALGPHSINMDELNSLFSSFDVEVLEEEEVGGLPRFQRLRDAGVLQVKQRAVLLKPQSCCTP